MGNIIKLVFQTIAAGSGFAEINAQTSRLQKNLGKMGQGAAILGRAFGNLGGIVGRSLGMLLQGGIWGAAANVAVAAIGKIADKWKEGAERMKKALQEQREAHVKLMDAVKSGYSESLSKIEKEATRRKELISLTQRQAKAEMELRRANALARGDTSTVAAIDDELSRHGGQIALEAADANVGKAEARVKAAKDALNELLRLERQSGEKLRKADAALASKSKPVQMVMQSSAGAYVHTVRRDTSAEKEAVSAAQQELDAAEERVDAARRAVLVEMQGLQDARRAREVVQMEVEAAEKKAVAERIAAEEAARKKKAEAEAAAQKAAEERHRKNLLAAAERAAATKWQLSPRELEMQRLVGKQAAPSPRSPDLHG